ncbi:MEI1 protein [Corchorus olitorius]|uniref:MEI1 protein n=1 Tax=Corchorus olitorius TaxID=93759 RepID=A0A1R3L071_9ROSI|nr:MEI1 protein [Corchorus olitorius]
MDGSISELVSSSAAEFLVEYKSWKEVMGVVTKGDARCDFFDWYDDPVCKKNKEIASSISR